MKQRQRRYSSKLSVRHGAVQRAVQTSTLPQSEHPMNVDVSIEHAFSFTTVSSREPRQHGLCVLRDGLQERRDALGIESRQRRLDTETITNDQLLAILLRARKVTERRNDIRHSCRRGQHRHRRSMGAERHRRSLERDRCDCM
jgi:hypothetical protein